MKRLAFRILLLIFIAGITLAQDKQDPFQGHYNLGNSSEIALFTHNVFRDTLIRHNIFDYYGNSGQYFLDSSSSGTYNGDLGTSFYDASATYHIEAITGDFNGDGYDNIVSAWVGKNNSINIVVPNIKKNTLTWNDESSLILPDVLPPNPNGSTTRFRLIKGFFDGDPEPNFVLAYWDKDGNIEIKIFDVDPGSLMPVEKTSIADEHLNYTISGDCIYDIAAGDFDGDGLDEIILTGYDEQSTTNWSIFTKIYDVTNNNGNLSLVPKVKKSDFYTYADYNNSNYRINKIVLVTGDFENNTLDQFAVDFVLYKTSNITYNKILPASVSMGLDTINVDLNKVADVFQTSGTSYVGIGAIAGDINNDGRDELVLDGDGRIRIYNMGSNLNLSSFIEYDQSSLTKNNQRMVLADLDASTADSIWNPEIVVTSTDEITVNDLYYSTLQIDVLEPVVDPSHNIVSLNHRATIVTDSTDGSVDYSWAVTAGDFDGGGIRLGKPRYFSATDIVQPLVILNAPPTHFDVFNYTTFDINESYNGQTSNFYSKYYTSTESEISVETELHKGWSVGTSVEGGFTIPIVDVGVKIKLESEYGKNFSKQKYNRNTYKVSQNISASNDDFIYATVVNYDIWEYPIIANDTIKGYSMVISPEPPKRTWFPSKSPQANDYLPDHEVGNILSYRQIASPEENGALQTSVKWNTSDEITLDGSPGFEYNWSLENSTQTEETNQHEVNFHIGASASFDVPFKFIPSFEIHGNYDQSTVSTRTNTVTYTQGLDVHLGPIDLGIGETYYSVTPYAYWAKSGALVLDYAVNPRPSGINVPETWWQERYSKKPDPALILPWRLDPEKGLSVSDEKRQETKEIIFNPDNPQPDQTVNIKTRIHNYSLLNTSGPVEARFYLGDPDNGGTLIQSTDGKTTFITDDFIPARGSKIISFDWKVPANATFFPKVYVVLDPDNKIDEIHESNNKGWKILSYQGATDVKDDKAVLEAYELSQNYPNPFNPTTTIEYKIPESGLVTIKVYDILGREVQTLVDQQLPAGFYETQFDGSNLASGIYFYRIKAGKFVQTKKLMLLK
jgi:hypothetical protein